MGIHGLERSPLSMDGCLRALACPTVTCRSNSVLRLESADSEEKGICARAKVKSRTLA